MADFCISQSYGHLKLVLRTHDMGGTDTQTFMPLTLEQATILGAAGCGIHWLHDPREALPEVPEGAAVHLLPSLKEMGGACLAVCVHDTVLVECSVDPHELSRAGVRVATRLDFPGRTPNDAVRAQAERLVDKARALRIQADDLLEQANALFCSLL